MTLDEAMEALRASLRVAAVASSHAGHHCGCEKWRDCGHMRASERADNWAMQRANDVLDAYDAEREAKAHVAGIEPPGNPGQFAVTCRQCARPKLPNRDHCSDACFRATMAAKSAVAPLRKAAPWEPCDGYGNADPDGKFMLAGPTDDPKSLLKQCEPWCGTEGCKGTSCCFGSLGKHLCSHACADAGRPVNPKVAP